MNLVTTPIVAIVVGLFVRSKMLGVLLYLAIQSIVFTFQSLVVLLSWLAGQGPEGPLEGAPGVFGPAPTEFPVPLSEPDIWLYGLINLAIFVIGVLLTLGTNSLRNRRRARAEQSIGVESAA